MPLIRARPEHQLQSAPYTNPLKKSSGPLDHVQRALRRQVDVRLALGKAGSALAGKLVDRVRRATLRDIRAPREAWKPTKKGGEYAPPRSTIVEFSGDYVHGANSPVVRRAAQLFALIASWCGPDGRTGHHKQGHSLNLRYLADKLGLEDPREVQRYLAVLRAAGLVAVWQPPDSSGCMKGNLSGHCFNLYEIELSPELERALAAFHRSWWPRRATLAPLDGSARFTGPDAIVAALRERKAPS